MANAIDYLDWRGDLSFRQSPFNEVDNLILCKLCCADLTGIVPENGKPIVLAEAAEKYFSVHDENERLGVWIPAEVLPMFKKLANTVRFGSLPLSRYINHVDHKREEQFSALTAYLPDGTAFVAFRGTDDTIVAWKENFNMSACDAVPAQTDAAEYLARIVKKFDGPVRVGGHSKGGNLAVYAMLHNPPEVQRRILCVYNNDGPGFREPVFDMPQYKRIRPKIVTLLPQYSLVGLLLSHEEDCEIVKSSETGIAAHNGFTWEVCGTRFVRCEDFAFRSKLFDKAFHAWADNIGLEKRRAFVDAFFDALTSAGARTLTDLNEHKLKQALEIAGSLRQDPAQRKLLIKTLELLLKEYVSTAREALPMPKIKLKGTLSALNLKKRTKNGKQ